MTKWEYARAFLKETDKNFLKTLNEWGNAGWELVTVYHDFGSEYSTFFFKRPKP